MPLWPTILHISVVGHGALHFSTPVLFTVPLFLSTSAVDRDLEYVCVGGGVGWRYVVAVHFYLWFAVSKPS